MDQGEDAVVASDLSVEYPAAHGSDRFLALRGVNLRIGPGELIGLVGETGSGKSTLARAIAGQLGRHSGEGMPHIVGGELRVEGMRVRGMGERMRRRLTAAVGYLPQNAGSTLRNGYTVAENVAGPLFERDRDFDQRDAGRRVAELIDAVQLPLGIMAKFPYELSNGQRQRVAIARSLILEPKLWVADEPTAGVDVTVRGPVLDTLFELQSDREITALIVSHDAAVMSRLTDRVAVMHRGILVGLGPLYDVLANAEHPYVRGLAADYITRTGSIPVVGTGTVPVQRTGSIPVVRTPVRPLAEGAAAR
jgi:peptide/nickel transport system ATP-binding protein